MGVTRPFRLLLLWCLLCGLLPPAGASAATPPSPLHVDRAEFAWGEGSTAPVTGWQAVSLPDKFTPLPGQPLAIGWYRVRFALQQVPEQPLVLLVPRVVVTAQFMLNGSPLNGDVRFGTDHGRIATPMHNQPHWVPLPPGLFRAGDNELLLRVQGNLLVHGGLSPLHIGTGPDLHGAFLLRHVPQWLLPQALAVLMAAALVFASLVWWRQRGPLQAHFIVVLLLWLAQLGMYLSQHPPASERTWTSAYLVLWVLFHWALLLLLWRYTGRSWRWFPRLLGAASLLVLPAALAVLAVHPWLEAMAAMLLVLMLLRLLTTAMLVRWAWRERSWRAALLTGAELLWFAGPLQLALVSMGWIPPEPFLLTPGSGLPLFVVLLVFFADRLVQSHDQALHERQAAIQLERQRLLQDMHDGIGSQLITASRLSRRDDVARGELTAVIDRALQDLRTIVDSLDAEHHELLPLLGHLRERLEPQLGRLGLQLQWDLQPLPQARSLPPADALQVLRLVQEAVNNVVQHAQATTVGVAVAPVPGGWQLRISDDGCGLDETAATTGRGHGLPGMQQRAARLGGQLRVTRGERGGTVVSLLVVQ